MPVMTVRSETGVESFELGDRPGPMLDEVSGETVYSGKIVENLGDGRYLVDTAPDAEPPPELLTTTRLLPDEATDGAERWNLAAGRDAELTLLCRPYSDEPTIDLAGVAMTRDDAAVLLRALAHILNR